MQDQDPEQHLHRKEESSSVFRSISGLESCSVWHSAVNPPHFDADPELTFYPDADPDPDYFFMRMLFWIRIQLFTLIRIQILASK
jgi:hypothetical protein